MRHPEVKDKLIPLWNRSLPCLWGSLGYIGFTSYLPSCPRGTIHPQHWHLLFAPAVHALPTSIHTGTMGEIEDCVDKDHQFEPAMLLMLGGLSKGGSLRRRLQQCDSQTVEGLLLSWFLVTFLTSFNDCFLELPAQYNFHLLLYVV